MDFTATTAAGLCFRKKIPKDLQTVSLDADMIRLLLAIDEHKSLYQIAAEVEMDAATFKKALRRLLEQGLLETVQKRAPLLGKSFLDAVRLNLSRAIGPMAQIVLEETVAEMNLDPHGIALDQAAELVNHLALEISGEESRIRFQKAMLPLLNKMNP
jgi:DNA-binding transcriptional regulator YhcF (GntR family)